MPSITSNPNFLFTYDFISGYIEHKGEMLTHLEFLTPSGHAVNFSAMEGCLEWESPFFLLENIFYLQVKNKIFFSDNINVLAGLSYFDEVANKALNKNGFIPHSMTQFHGVKVICSFLKYSISPFNTAVTPCFNYRLDDNYFYTIDDLFQALRLAFLNQVQRLNVSNLVLPISGGMDSRLLLELLLGLKNRADLKLFTVGTPDSGDVLLAKKMAKNLGLTGQHIVVSLDDISKGKLIENYSATNYMLPLDRILTASMSNFIEPSTIVSGLYGDVIFADNKREQKGYVEYVTQEGFTTTNELDLKIMAAYDQLPRLPKLHRTLLRCQKLTRQSFSINKGFNYIAPFVDPMVILIASSIEEKNIYSKIVNRYMRNELKKYIHQSTLSFFTHPPLVRKLERKFFKLLRHPYRKPYYDPQYLSDIGVVPNEAPIIKFK